VSWSEVVALCRRFHGWGEERVATQPACTPATDPLPTGLALRAFRVTCWIRDEQGPDLVVLRSRDPAHPEAYFPTEVQPDRGMAILAIREEPERAWIEIGRDSERCTFEVRRSGMRGGVGAGHGHARPAGPGVSSPRAPRSQATCVDAKLVPFFGRGGVLGGVRVTGVRPGSVLAEAGLRPGDVVQQVDGKPVASLEGVRRQLCASRLPGTLGVHRGAARVELALPGGR
jgi:hypothetical protein